MRWFLTPGVVILAALASWAGKLTVRRPRPGSSYRVAPWGRLGAAGFPSTHSACAFAAAAWLRTSPQSGLLHVLALLIGYSRVRCRAHHPADVAAGAILGYGIAWQLDRALPQREPEPFSGLSPTIEKSFRNKGKKHSYTHVP